MPPSRPTAVEAQAGQASTSAAELLAEARARLDRLSPGETAAAIAAGALLIDIRSEGQQRRDGVVPGARHVARNVFEWRCDPNADWADPEIVRDPERQLIVICHEGYQSSLVAELLQRFGFARATDVVGGFQAWREAGLPVATA
jgi:rhodanese-related sulfurtransferase